MTGREFSDDAAGGLDELDARSLLVLSLGIAIGFHALMLLLVLPVLAVVTGQPYPEVVASFYDGVTAVFGVMFG